MLPFVQITVALALVIVGLQKHPAKADALDTIKAKGELVVGTKIDYPPYGFQDKDGNIIGIDPDLAADLAKRLGVKLRLEPVASAKRIPMLQEGKIDLIVATFGITDERKKMAGFIDPAYYASGIAALARPQVGLQSEADLDGKSVCAVKGNFFNKDLQSLYVHKDLIMVNDVLEAHQALSQGRCIVFVFDDTGLIALKKYQPEMWKEYNLFMFAEVDPLLWGIAVKLEDRDSAYGKAISEAIVDWHKTGWLADLEKKWLGRNTPWVLGIREKYRRNP